MLGVKLVQSLCMWLSSTFTLAEMAGDSVAKFASKVPPSLLESSNSPPEIRRNQRSRIRWLRAMLITAWCLYLAHPSIHAQLYARYEARLVAEKEQRRSGDFVGPGHSTEKNGGND